MLDPHRPPTLRGGPPTNSLDVTHPYSASFPRKTEPLRFLETRHRSQERSDRLKCETFDPDLFRFRVFYLQSKSHVRTEVKSDKSTSSLWIETRLKWTLPCVSLPTSYLPQNLSLYPHLKQDGGWSTHWNPVNELERLEIIRIDVLSRIV